MCARLQLGLLAATLASGCVALTDFNPVGNEAAIAGAWTIDGQAPDTDGCRRLAANTRAQVTFYDGASVDDDDRIDITAARPVFHTGLRFACEARRQRDQVVGAFDTRDRNRRVVAEGEWVVAMEAVTGDGRRLVIGTPRRFSTSLATCADGDAAVPCLDLGTQDFPSGRILAAWTVSGENANGRRCTAAAIDAVTLTFSDAPAPVASLSAAEQDALGGIGACADFALPTTLPQPETSTAPCSVGSIGASLLPCVRYTAQLTVDGGGRGDPTSFFVEPIPRAPTRESDIPRLGGSGFTFELSDFTVP